MKKRKSVPLEVLHPLKRELTEEEWDRIEKRSQMGKAKPDEILALFWRNNP